MTHQWMEIKLKELEKRIKALEQKPSEDMGEVSDGYHTFNQLYYQRAVLFAAIVNLNKDKAWKSFKHSDGKYCFDSNGEWFIVGVDTPKGSYTYHYSKKYWNMFDCKELECGKEWDGHTEEDVTRLLSLEQDELYDFARWVAEEIFDDNWEYNKDGFAELACRKLAKIGIIRAKDNEWELIESQESEDEE